MQAEIVQWEKSVKAECIFYIDVMGHQNGISLSKYIQSDLFDKETPFRCLMTSM